MTANKPAQLVCPSCADEVAPGAEFCPACGFSEPGKPPADLAALEGQPRVQAAALEALRKGAGPFSFRFEEVKTAIARPARVPNSTGVNFNIAAAGLLAGALGGLAAYFLLVLLALLALAVSRSAFFSLMVMIIAPFVLFLVPFGGGWLAGAAINKRGMAFNSTDWDNLRRIGALSALAAFGVFALTHYLRMGPAEWLDSWVDWAWLLVALPGFLFGAWGSSGEELAKEPYCETCRKYMRKTEFGRPVGMQAPGGFPIRFEPRLLEALKSGRLAAIAELGADWVAENFVTLTFWDCEGCEEDGYVNLQTTQTRNVRDNKGNLNLTSQTRLVFSQRIGKEAISALREAARALIPAAA
ncbi:MAG: zinc ribbon domain-containing protein [Chloroflexi bacterium]|nr:zinc ribbon domain-containing protein [Chloroflexota bacterium]